MLQNINGLLLDMERDTMRKKREREKKKRGGGGGGGGGGVGGCVECWWVGVSERETA